MMLDGTGRRRRRGVGARGPGLGKGVVSVDKSRALGRFGHQSSSWMVMCCDGYVLLPENRSPCVRERGADD